MSAPRISARRRTLLAVATALALCVLASGALRAYVLSGRSWATTSVTYYVNTASAPAGLDPNSFIAGVQSGAGGWSSQANPNITLRYGGTTNVAVAQYDGVNAVFFRPDSGPFAYTTYWFDSNNHLLDADLALYAGTATWYTGSTGCAGAGAYVEDVTTHEFGHVLGLAHSDVGTATMYPSANYCTTDLRSLDPDDVSGIQALYPPVGTPPAAPSNLSAADSTVNPTSAIALSWTDNSMNESGYIVYRSTDGLNFNQAAQLSSGVVSFTDNNLTAGASYYYRVSAYNSAGTSGFSNVANAQTAPVVSNATAPPSAPNAPTPSNGATGVNTSVTLSWSASGAQAYDVTVYSGGSTTPIKSFTNLTSPSVSVSGLANSTGYSWTVVAKNSAGSTAGPTWTFTTKSKPGNSKH
jgi:hypothetical protein